MKGLSDAARREWHTHTFLNSSYRLADSKADRFMNTLMDIRQVGIRVSWHFCWCVSTQAEYTSSLSCKQTQTGSCGIYEYVYVPSGHRRSIRGRMSHEKDHHWLPWQSSRDWSLFCVYRALSALRVRIYINTAPAFPCNVSAAPGLKFQRRYLATELIL